MLVARLENAAHVHIALLGRLMHQPPPLGAGRELQRPHLHDCKNGQQQLTSRPIRDLGSAEVFERRALPVVSLVHGDPPTLAGGSRAGPAGAYTAVCLSIMRRSYEAAPTA